VTGLEMFVLGLLAVAALVFGVFPWLVFDNTIGTTTDVLRMIGK
jgi:NADH:ubiquinone oxidoreductase subunit 4 (subunit M)